MCITIVYNVIHTHTEKIYIIIIIAISPNTVYDDTRRYLTVLICFAYRAVGRGKASTVFI